MKKLVFILLVSPLFLASYSYGLELTVFEDTPEQACFNENFNPLGDSFSIELSGRLFPAEGFDQFILPPPSICCDVEMEPDEEPIIVPPGGSFGYTGTVCNPTFDPIVTDVWVVLEFEEYRRELRMYGDIPLGVEQCVSVHLVQRVCQQAEPGEYVYRAYCGNYDDLEPCDSSSFTFTVASARTWGDRSDALNELPAHFGQIGNYPNPFNAETKIAFNVPESNQVSLRIYNLLGQEVAELVNEHLDAGIHSVTWDASNSPSGVYFYKLTIADRTVTKKMQLLK